MPVEARAKRVVAVVDLGQPVGDGELQLVRPEPAGLVLGREPEPRPWISGQ